LTRLGVPLRVQWAIALLTAAIVVAALIIFVDHNNSNSDAKGNAHALARENAEAQILIGQLQAPQTARIAAGQSAAAAAVVAVRRTMRQRIATGNVAGTFQHITCQRSGTRGSRHAVSCTATAGNVKYPYLGVADLTTKTLTYCWRDIPPLPSERIPVSPRCRL
jgi:hypothetical protein